MLRKQGLTVEIITGYTQLSEDGLPTCRANDYYEGFQVFSENVPIAVFAYDARRTLVSTEVVDRDGSILNQLRPPRPGEAEAVSALVGAIEGLYATTNETIIRTAQTAPLPYSAWWTRQARGLPPGVLPRPTGRVWLARSPQDFGLRPQPGSGQPGLGNPAQNT